MEIPIWEKYALSVEEAARYFNIGENRIRSVIQKNPSAEWVLWAGSKVLVKREKFEKALDRLNTI